MTSLLPLDLVLLGGVALLVGIGLYRGLSGELASLAGFAAAAAGGGVLYGYAHICVRAIGFNKGDTTELVATGVAVFVLGLIVFGIVRKMVDKFVSFLVPQPTNALLGALSGVLKSLVILFLLTGVGFMRPGTYATGFLAARSQIVHALAEWADNFSGEGSGEAPGDPGEAPGNPEEAPGDPGEESGVGG